MIKVYIVDDSATVRKILTNMLSHQPGIQVIGAAANPIFAWRRMQNNWPDVIISDIEMPQMDGIEFLKKLMLERPTPVVICSAYVTTENCKTVEALARGAVEIIEKPKLAVGKFLQQQSKKITDTIRNAAQANISAIKAAAVTCNSAQTAHGTFALNKSLESTHAVGADAILTSKPCQRIPSTAKLITIGCSTGGTQALEKILANLNSSVPGIVIVQHMPEKFTAAFAKRLNTLCTIEVKEAQDGDIVEAGHAYLSPGNKHLLIKRSHNQYTLRLKDGPPVNRHKPSVDVLFRSTAQSAGKNAVGYLLTGMGRDGARGLLEMREAKATTYAQSERTCAVFGMPGSAIKLNAAQYQIDLGNIADSIERVV